MSERGAKPEPYGRIGVIGAGAWGTSLALTAARAGRLVTLWAREPEVVKAVTEAGENTPFLPGIRLHDAIAPTADMAEAVKTSVINKRAGGMGLISGRKAFQRPMAEGVKLLNAIQDVYLDASITVA